MADVLACNGISKAFGGLQALNHVDVRIEKNKVTGLIGPNGAGKTTLFNVLSGFLKPDSGHVYLNSENIKKKSPDDIVHLGMVRSWQALRLFENLTVLENMIISIPKNKDESYLAILLKPWRKNSKKIVQAMEILNSLKMDGKANQIVKDLSYAEQKLISIGRLLSTGADLLLLDEPTSGLDEKTVDKVIAPLLRNLASNKAKTICLVEHSIKVVFSMCDYVICLNEGKVVAFGDPKDLRNDNELKRAFFYGV